MERMTKFNRFDPVTVRAAARLVRLEQLGRLHPGELDWYLRELAMLSAGAALPATRELRRLATRQAAFGRTGVSAAAAGTLKRVNPRPPKRKPALAS